MTFDTIAEMIGATILGLCILLTLFCIFTPED